MALARALAVKPTLLMLDEPLGALDKKLREQMQLALMDLQRALGMTMIYVTHDQEEALSMSQRVAVMADGEVIQYDTPTRLYYEPATSAVCQFVGKTNTFPDEVVTVNGEFVRTAAGLIGASRDQLRPRQSCVICVRPERIHVASEPAEGERLNHLTGVVRERVFLGQTTSYMLDLDGGARIEASAFSETAPSELAEGARVVASFDAASALCFSAHHDLGEAKPRLAGGDQDVFMTPAELVTASE